MFPGNAQAVSSTALRTVPWKKQRYTSALKLIKQLTAIQP